MTTTENVENKTAGLLVEIEDTGEEMTFDKLIITGDDSDYDILDEEYETIYLNNIVWVRVKKELW